MERMERIENCDVCNFCAQGILGADGFIRTSTVSYPAAASVLTVHAGLGADIHSSFPFGF
jgi:hypothetical protein